MANTNDRSGLAGLVLALALLPSVAAGDPHARMQVLEFRQFEPLVGEYPSRILLTDRFVRIDDGEDAGDYALFDRRTGVVTSVSHGRQSLFEVHPREADPALPPGLKTEVLGVKGRGEYAGVELTSIRYHAGTRVCGGAEIAPGWSEPARQALMEYHAAIASNNAADLGKTPDELRDGCFYVDQFLLHPESLARGFPVVIWRADGERRILVSHAALPLRPELFVLPDYPAFSLSKP